MLRLKKKKGQKEKQEGKYFAKNVNIVKGDNF